MTLSNSQISPVNNPPQNPSPEQIHQDGTDKFRIIVESALNRQGRGKQYERRLAFTFGFEADQTRAKQDRKAFHSVFSAIGFNVKNFIVDPAKTPANTDLKNFDQAISSALLSDTKPTLVVGHYAGYAGYQFPPADPLGHLSHPGWEMSRDFFLTPQSRDDNDNRPMVFFRESFINLLDSRYLNHVDFVMVLDCCQARFNFEYGATTARSIEIISSSRADKSTRNAMLPRGRYRSFTARFVENIVQRTAAGQTNLAIADVVGEMQNIRESDLYLRPEYRRFAGIDPIQIPIRLIQGLKIDCKPLIDPKPTVIIHLHIQNDDGADRKVEEFWFWTENFQSPDIEFLGCVKKRLVLILLEVPWSFYYQYLVHITNIVFVGIIGDSVKPHGYISVPKKEFYN